MAVTAFPSAEAMVKQRKLVEQYKADLKKKSEAEKTAASEKTVKAEKVKQLSESIAAAVKAVAEANTQYKKLEGEIK